MPFVTQGIFEQITESTIGTASSSEVRADFENAAAAAGVEALKDLSCVGRNARSEVNMAPSKPITQMEKTTDPTLETFVADNVDYIERFTTSEPLEIASNTTAPVLSMSAVSTGAVIYRPLPDLLNFEEELERLSKELAK